MLCCTLRSGKETIFCINLHDIWRESLHGIWHIFHLRERGKGAVRRSIQLKIVLKEETPSRTSDRLDRQSLNFVQRDMHLSSSMMRAGFCFWVSLIPPRRFQELLDGLEVPQNHPSRSCAPGLRREIGCSNRAASCGSACISSRSAIDSIP